MTEREKLDALSDAFFDIQAVMRKSFASHKNNNDCGAPFHKKTFSHADHVIHVLIENGEMPMSELAAALSISNQQLTPLIDKLDEQRITERAVNPENRRVVLVRINERFGREMHDKFKNHIKENISELLRRFSPEDGDEFVRLMTALCDLLQKATF